MASLAVSPHTTVAALKAANRILGHNRVWSPKTDTQRNWLASAYASESRDLARLPEIFSNAATKIEDHVAFLAQHGWQAQFTDPLRSGDIALAAVLDILVEWLCTGKPYAITGKDQNSYAGFQIKNQHEVDNLVIFEHKLLDAILFRLKTKTDDVVYIAEAPNAPIDDLDLICMAAYMTNESLRTQTNYKSAVFPKVDLSTKQNLNWLPGLRTTGNDGHSYTIAKAVQQTTLKMNEQGARARAASEMIARRGMSHDDSIIIDQPFLLSIVRPGVRLPVFCAYVDYDMWRDPGSLGL